MQKVATTRINRRFANRSLEDGTAMRCCIHATASLIEVRSPEHGSEWEGLARERRNVEQLRRGLEAVAGEKAQTRHIPAQTQTAQAPEAQQTHPEDETPPCSSIDAHTDLASCACRRVLVGMSTLPR